IGRQPVIESIADSFDEGPGAPGRLTVFTGARGVGKTVMLNEVEEVANSRGWLTIDETATTGLVARIEEHLTHLAEAREPRPRRRITGITLPLRLGAVSTEVTPDLAVDVRRRLSSLLDELKRSGSGLLLTIDEVHAAARSELREVTTITQHLIREDREFALVMAGLPSAVSSLLSDDVLTFLRRADKQVLSDVPIDEVHDALLATIIANGRTIDEEAGHQAAEATGGYPFLVQLVGYHVWRSTAASHITLTSARDGITAARRRLGSLVHETALNDLSDVDRTFLMAMSPDPGPSRMRDILKRMGGVAPQYGNVYKNRLIDAGMIGSVAHGKVDYSLPYLRDFLREHGASLGLAPIKKVGNKKK
ncbi:MAG: hypothetical protein JWM51_2198, partial [Microbacteriaceae bacterium]|nr:hypothetical protein [Microbacteriaceae bacterium]